MPRYNLAHAKHLDRGGGASALGAVTLATHVDPTASPTGSRADPTQLFVRSAPAASSTTRVDLTTVMSVRSAPQCYPSADCKDDGALLSVTVGGNDG